MSPTAALLLAQAQSYTRFGNGAKKSFANEVTNPGTWRQKIPRKTPRQDEDAELTEIASLTAPAFAALLVFKP